MPIGDSFTGAAAVANKLRTKSLDSRPWQLRWKPVCASTEKDLSIWLREKPFKDYFPRALIAARQTHGIGQRGRPWESPFGGVWLSAALPMSEGKKSAGLLGLAIAVALSKRLERAFVPVQIKWPNDLVVGDKKLAGLLPRLIYRGETLRFGRVGLGLNVCNRVPIEGISLAEILSPKHCHPLTWAVEVLLALEHAVELVGDTETVRVEAERILWANKVKDPHSGEIWKIDGLTINGALKLRNGFYKTVWDRWE